MLKLADLIEPGLSPTLSLSGQAAPRSAACSGSAPGIRISGPKRLARLELHQAASHLPEARLPGWWAGSSNGRLPIPGPSLARMGLSEMVTDLATRQARSARGGSGSTGVPVPDSQRLARLVISPEAIHCRPAQMDHPVGCAGSGYLSPVPGKNRLARLVLSGRLAHRAAQTHRNSSASSRSTNLPAIPQKDRLAGSCTRLRSRSQTVTFTCTLPGTNSPVAPLSTIPAQRGMAGVGLSDHLRIPGSQSGGGCAGSAFPGNSAACPHSDNGDDPASVGAGGTGYGWVCDCGDYRPWQTQADTEMKHGFT